MIYSGNRIKELDGLRGIAIIMVFLYHCLPRSLFISNNAYTYFIYRLSNMGWSGVDLFFVLSGFLITSILLRSKDKPNYFVNFYARRILRIFPLYYFSLILIFTTLPFINAKDFLVISNFQIWYYLYIQNWITALSLINIPSYFGHYWSLAIEEQFYVIWPAIIYNLKNKYILIVCGIITTMSLFYRLYSFLSTKDENIGNYLAFSSITRIDGLMIGAFVAVMLYDGRLNDKLVGYAKILSALSVILISLFILNNTASIIWNNPPMLIFGFTVLGVLAGCLVIISILSPYTSFLRLLLRGSVLSFFGKYSYAMYIFHFPIILAYVFLFGIMKAHGIVFWCFFLVSCAATTILASLISWHALEKHAIGLKRYFA